jgi:ribosomal-protein-alanine N-acetyltransferase
VIDWPTLQSDRLILREPANADLPAMPGVFSDPDIYAYTRNIPYPYTESDAVSCLARYQRLAREDTALTLFPELRESREIIGLVVLIMSPDKPEAELGYAIGRRWWGKGYATEASHALLAHGFDTLDFEQINAHAMLRNPASSRVLEKLGMHSVGITKDACEKDGDLFDAEGFLITRHEWSQR